MPGAVRASAGINVSDDDVQRLLAAVASIAAGDPPVRYHQDPSTGDFFPAESTFADGYREPVQDKCSLPEGLAVATPQRRFGGGEVGAC